MTTVFEKAAAKIAEKLGTSATFIPKFGDEKICKVNLVRNVDQQPYGFDSTVAGQEKSIECLLSDIGKEPEPGELFRISNQLWEVKGGPIENDGLFVKVTVRWK